MLIPATLAESTVECLFATHGPERPWIYRLLLLGVVGALASLPIEKITLENDKTMEAFLIEARSIGGLSGSPVFLHLGYIRQVDGAVALVKNAPLRGGSMLLMGLVYGQYPINDISLEARGG